MTCSTKYLKSSTLRDKVLQGLVEAGLFKEGEELTKAQNYLLVRPLEEYLKRRRVVIKDDK